eukprot:TRINITY_DN3762_c0_g1_i7.p1 TRINITY_DN3762_c0_g1~~TRINITY_DN3762_c0_g1_i7.p1  ORF type:complete len:165 (+),score=22.47 TRINITY_DN3762_c0_g1_i7:217-711(+)
MSGRYLQYSPAAGGASPHYNHLTMSSMSLPMRGPSTPQEHDSARYLKELVEERQKLGPFMQVLPICSRLLNQEILRLSTLVNQGFVDHDRLEHGSPMASSGLLSNGGAMDLGCWPSLQSENLFVQAEFESETRSMDGTELVLKNCDGISTVITVDIDYKKWNYC